MILMKIFRLDIMDRIGTAILLKSKPIILDSYGLKLFNKHMGKNGWSVNFSTPHLHRFDCIGIDSKGKLRYRVIYFYRELLGLPKSRPFVYFMNGDRLDLRIYNMFVEGYDSANKIIT